MKKFLFALIVGLFVASTTHAEIRTFTGTLDMQPLAASRTATGEVKIFTADASGRGAPHPGYGKVISSATNKVRQQMAAFVTEYCRSRKLKITDDKALAAVDFSAEIKIDKSRESIDYFSVTAKGSLYMDKLDTWINQNLRR